VARAVYAETQNGSVYLDITHRDSSWLSSRFPSIQEHVQKYQLDLSKDWLPVIPAAHYTCGGIATDLCGRTSLKGLFAAGEAARTGLHGGNRLASTSLLEGLVFGSSVADFCGTQGRDALSDAVATNVTSSKPLKRKTQLHMEPSHIESAAHRAMKVLSSIRRTMWDHVGVVRTQDGLSSALQSLQTFLNQSENLYATCPTLETAAVRDAAHAGMAVTEAALANPVSAGAHYLVELSLSPVGAQADDSDEEEGAVAAAR
jgi:L-aspartate oxidase